MGNHESSASGRVRVYIAASIDGFIAGPGNDLSWLPELTEADLEDAGGVRFEEFIADVGALLMGRATFDVLMRFDVGHPYGERPVLVASHRDLGENAPPGFRRVEGSIEELVADARRTARGGDVYIDGGDVIRQACDAGLVDELIVTVAPTALGAGHPLFAGLRGRYDVEIAEVQRFAGGMIQLRLVPRG